MSVLALFPDSDLPAPIAHSATLSAQIVAEVREALFDRRLKPGDFLGTEKDLAARSGVSRIVARDALKSLQALGVIEIKVGAGGGARIARGNPLLFADALAVQLGLVGITVRELLDAQRAVECVAAELAAENATAEDLARLRTELARGAASLGDPEAFTRSSLALHLAMAEASHNRVLVAQLQSLQHVACPSQNRMLTGLVAKHILDVHHELVELVAARDAPAARRLMDDHVKMIRARRLAERRDREPAQVCC